MEGAREWKAEKGLMGKLEANERFMSKDICVKEKLLGLWDKWTDPPILSV